MLTLTGVRFRLATTLFLCIAFGTPVSYAVPAKKATSTKGSYSPPPFPFKKIPSDDQVQLTGPAKTAWDKGEAAFKESKFADAVVAFKEVAGLQPGFSRAYERLGSAQAATENYNDAEVSIKKAIELAPKDYLPHLILGRIVLVKKGEKEGVEEAQKAYDLNPWACAAFLEYSNKDRFDPHKWFILANYWKELKAKGPLPGSAPPTTESGGSANPPAAPGTAPATPEPAAKENP